MIWGESLLNPAIGLINRLKYPQKFGLISLCFLLPLGLAIFLLLSEIQGQIQFTQLEQQGLSYLRPLQQLQQTLLSQSVVDFSVRDRQWQLARQGLITVQHQGSDGLNTDNIFQIVDQVLPTTLPANPGKQVSAWLEAIAILRTQVGNQSNLILDPDLDSYYLMDALLLKLPTIQKDLAQLIPLIDHRNQQPLSSLQESQLLILKSQLTQLSDGLNRNLGVAFLHHGSPDWGNRLGNGLGSLSLSLQDLDRSLADLLMGTPGLTVSALNTKNEWALLNSFHLWQVLRPALDHLLGQRIQGFRQRQILLSGFVLSTLAIAVYLFWGFYRSVMQTVASLSQAAAKMVEGNQAQAVVLQTQDEMAEVVRSFNALADALCAAEAKYRNIVENSVVGIYQTNLAGQYLTANPMLAQIYGYQSPTDLIENLTDIGHKLYVQGDRRQQFMDCMAQDGKVWGFESQVYRRDGSTIWISEAARLLIDDQGQAMGFEGTVVDISQRKADEQEIDRLTQRLKRENLRLEAEIDITRQLQQMLMPSEQELAAVAGLDIAGFMESASEVGGDYYDVLQTNGQVRISIGDVTGHGLESSLVMIMAQTALRTLLEHGETDPVRLLNAINRTIYENTRRMGSLKNMTLSVLQYEAGLMRLSGQHEEVLIIRHNGDSEQIDTFELGFPLGLEADISNFVTEREFHLAPGDLAVLYTDGITEAMNDRRQFYGLDRLQAVLCHHRHQTAEEIRQAAIADLRDFVGNQPLTDDITLLILKQQ
ncbi:MAG: SpoIIE family protein phosphatase [Synechocystis sp.]|nr:SpoIIE family protein phosphatase [Synechocystis sp.]